MTILLIRGMYLCMYICMYVCVCMYVYMYVCVCVCMCVCVYMYILHKHIIQFGSLANSVAFYIIH